MLTNKRSLDYVFVGLMVFVRGTAAASQKEINYIARYLDLKYEVIENKPDGTYVDLKLTLRNTGTEAIPRADWEVYFSHVRFVESENLRFNKDGVTVDDFTFYHVNGVLYKMAPATSFSELASDAVKTVAFKAQNWIVSRTDIMPNWYVTWTGLEPKVIQSTAGQSLSFVGAFDSEKKWKRYSADEYNPYTPEARYDRNHVMDRGNAGNKVIPTPVTDNLSENSGSVDLSSPDWTIVYTSQLQNEANFLADKTGFVTSTESTSSRLIHLQTATIDNVDSDEGYHLQVSPDDQNITITGVTSAGVFYGVQTLLALLAAGHSIPGGEIVDYPRYRWRGMHYDNGRNYHGEGALYKMVDAMAMYKLNRLHLHITDDEGWRLEITGLPELTQVGGHRCHDLGESSCVITQLGSSPTDTMPGSGYVTSERYKDFLRYAKDRHVTVIPEFDMPGHAHAAIIAMRARYYKYNETNMTLASQYVLEDTNDTSKYYSVQDFTDNAINPCLDSTYEFIEKLITGVKALHEDVQPLEIFHFGGDEAAGDAWSESPVCDDLRQELGIWKNISGVELKRYFVRRLSEISAKHGLRLAGWEDGLYDRAAGVPYNRSTLENSEVYANVWDNIWEWGTGDRAYVLANHGYKVIMSHATHTYFDHPYEPDPEERGYYWATRFTDVKKMFGFMPDDLYANIDQERSGKELTRDACGVMFTCTPLEQPDNVIGMQGQVWSETIRTAEQLYYMVFPRLLALAERAWHKAAWETQLDVNQRRTQMEEDWRSFANSLGYRELKRLDDIGVTYRVPPPGLKISGGSAEGDTSVHVEGQQLLVTSGLPGLPQRYSTDGGATWTDVRGAIPAQPSTTYQVVTRSADLSRTSRMISVTTGASSSGHLQITTLVLLCSLLWNWLNKYS